MLSTFSHILFLFHSLLCSCPLPFSLSFPLSFSLSLSVSVAHLCITLSLSSLLFYVLSTTGRSFPYGMAYDHREHGANILEWGDVKGPPLSASLKQ